MKPFLEHVATDIFSKYGTDLSGLTVIFPNKRASLFLNQHLARLCGGKPFWSPAYITISDLFRRQSARRVADPVKLVCDLHRSFTAQTGIDETLDHFFGWGQLLLADFDDIDKQLADADRIFANLSDLHELDDDSFLTEAQREVLRHFFSNFSDSHNSELKQRFLRLWEHIGDIYHEFNRHLADQGLAYEGALYREVVEGGGLGQPSTLHLFVGFNALQPVEQKLFSLLHRQGKARFYWDFDLYYTQASTQHEAGHFLRHYLELFPNELDSTDAAIYDCFSRPKRICIVSATTENIQARYASQWLKNGGGDAIVMCNEGLLPTIMHCLPDEVEKVNITTGYPLVQAPVASLISQLVALRRDGYDHKLQRFRRRYADALLRHPYLVGATPEQKALLFRPVHPLYQNEELLAWLCEVLQNVARQRAAASDQGPAGPLKEESIFRAYTLLNRLLTLAHNGDLQTDIITLGRLITQLLQQTTVPLHGEPVEGLQVMGMLETRNLDFSRLLILSANEGNLPRGVSDTSFIPYSLRRAYGLTTPDHKVALYSYYFHRLLQRADNITIVYNSATTDGQKGEMSRFLLQLMVESPHPVSRLTLQGGLATPQLLPQSVANKARPPRLLTPTAINRFLRCPLQFHYRYVCNLTEPDSTDEDTIDNRIFGNIFHEASRIVYTRLMEKSQQILASDIDYLLKTNVDIERAVDTAFRQELFHTTTNSTPPTLNGLQLISRQVIIHYLRRLLSTDRRLTPFTILALEHDVSMPFNLQPSTVNSKPSTVNLGGRIDRLDMITDSNGQKHIRVIDYKTGARRLKPLPDVDAVFLQDSLKDHSDYYLQALLYSVIVARQHPQMPVSPALLFIQHAGADDYDPVLSFGKEPISDVTNHETRFMELLADVVNHMFDPSSQFTPTADTQRCQNCPYRLLCR